MLFRLDPQALQQHQEGGWQCDEEDEAVIGRYPTAGHWHVLFLGLTD